jgi:hypothetical protein
MPVRLSREDVVTIEALAQKGQNNSERARTLGASEGTVRYHRRRANAGAEDGQRDKPFASAARSGPVSQRRASERSARGSPALIAPVPPVRPVTGAPPPRPSGRTA